MGLCFSLIDFITAEKQINIYNAVRHLEKVVFWLFSPSQQFWFLHGYDTNTNWCVGFVCSLNRN